MAAHVSITPNGILTVLGGSTDDVVAITQSPGSNGPNGPVEVRTAVGDEEPSILGTWNDLTAIFIYLGNGNNRVDLETRALPALVLTGNGIDLVSIVNHNTENAVVVSTGGGDDLIHVQDAGSYGTAVLAGAGNDGITFSQASSVAARRSIAFGGDGNDFLQGPGNADVELGIHDAGMGFVTFYGGAGSDRFQCFNVDTVVHGGESPRDHDAATYCLASGTLLSVPANELESPIQFDIVVVVPPAP
jgi:hypothetical protein